MNFVPPFNLWNSSSGNGKGYTSFFSTGFTVTLKSPHMRTLPSGFLTTTIGVAQSDCDTFSITPLFSSRSNSAPTTGFIANGSLRGLQNFGVASSLSVNVAFAVMQQPRPSLKISPWMSSISCNLSVCVFTAAVTANCVGSTQMLRLTRPSLPISYVYPPP